MYSESEVKEATLAYFAGDELATNVFMTKYCLRNEKGAFMERTPDDMHHRMSSEFARMETKFDKEGAAGDLFFLEGFPIHRPTRIAHDGHRK